MDDRPPPEAVVARGMELKLDIPLDKLGPSIAMLPSADAAMVAFAEVTSFVRHFVADQGPEALPKLLAALRDRKKPDEALQLVSGLDLQGWDARWRKALASISHDPEQLKSILRKSHQDHRDARERLRLAELLMGRGHWRSAEVQLGKVKGDDFAQDPTLRYLRVRAREALGERQDLLPVLGEPSTIVGGYGPWWGLRGRLLEGGGDFNGSGQAFFEALAVDPLDLEAACGTERTDIPPQQTAPQQRHPEEPSYGFLCEAARQRGEPPLGQD
jgi:hypothetical protein